MKKNFMMRAASVLLVAVMLTTCAISGTFAKYVTSGSAEDSARVAKWGVNITASGNLFNNSYIHAPANSGELTVVSEGGVGDDVVAPGTWNTEGLTMTVTGTPEVDVNVKFDLSNVEDIFLAAGSYYDVTTGTNTEDTFTVADGGYKPVKFTLTQTKGSSTANLVTEGTLADVATAIDGLDATYEAGANLADEVGTLKLTWFWNYTAHAGVENDDRADTVLGDLAAGSPAVLKSDKSALTVDTDYNLEVAIAINVTVTQID